MPARPRADSAWPRVALLALTLAGAWLRARDLGGFAITHWDEGLAWRGARYFASFGAEGHYSPSLGPPLVPLLFAAALLAVDELPVVAVAANVLLSALAIPLIWVVAGRLVSRRAGWIAAVLMATSGLHVMYARTLLMEPAYTLLFLGVLGASARALETGSTRWYVVTSALVVGLQYTKYNGVLAAGPLVLVLLWDFARAPEENGLGYTLRRCSILLVPAVLAALLNVFVIARVADLPAFLEHYGRYVGGGGKRADVVGTLLWTTPSALVALAVFGLALTVRPVRRPLVLLHLGFALYLGFLMSYATFLRLFVPVVTLLLVYAAAGLDRLVDLRPALPARIAAGLIAIAVLAQVTSEFDRHHLERFDGYQVATAYLEGLEDPAPFFLVAQDGVWDGLSRPVASGDLPSEKAERALAGTAEVTLVCDIGAFSRLRPRDLGPVLARLEERGYLLARIENTLNLDALQNNLTLEELRRLDDDARLRERVLSIHVFRVPADELERTVTELAVLR